MISREGIPQIPEPSRLRTEYLRLKSVLYDPNTGLDASAAILERVRALFHHTRSIGLIHLQIDPSSRLEGIYGWQVLDGLLREVATNLEDLRGCGVPSDSLVSQVGIHSDRFLLFVPLVPGRLEAQKTNLSRIREAVEGRMDTLFAGMEYRSMTPRPAPRIGSTIVSDHPFFRLERQIYEGIDRAGSSESRAGPEGWRRWQAELERIVKEQAIETLFQPVVDLDDNHVIGYEALTRGPRATDFEMPLSLFERSKEIGIAEELDRVCRHAALTHARKLEPGDKLFINALPDSLLEPGFRDALLADLQQNHPVARQDIVLEITDRWAIHDYEAFCSEVSNLKACGFRMSFDNVGKSSTSLESLLELEPDFIKIDGSLIRNIHKNLIKQELVRSLCRAAQTIDSQIIAEGIETRDEMEAVKRCGVQMGQGYYFSRPSRELPVRGVKVNRTGM